MLAGSVGAVRLRFANRVPRAAAGSSSWAGVAGILEARWSLITPVVVGGRATGRLSSSAASRLDLWPRSIMAKLVTRRLKRRVSGDRSK